ncbi:MULTISPECIES: hypothetical protein [unclassified Bacillus (in: firmicutes)]|uniref:hypothetical protein n=1 Tax=unclassified Bacillus (in: firmicutes) TaxID=185979 RepID=UPI000BF665B9|nr:MULTISPECIES: hypothetical protein [unclassified Bacillus (in: firmicutes)]PEU18148.1 hypothetical protein CN525_13090 [Bacillus sp. AFS014408]PFW62417.1 hypothetical protein COL20_13300 [Bacillus sp. AFS075034]
MRVYQLDHTQLKHTLTPTRMCNGVLQYYQYKQYTAVSVLDLSRHDVKMIPLLLTCVADALMQLNQESFLAKDENNFLYWCRRDFTAFHSISDDGFLQDFRQIYKCYQALRDVREQEDTIQINM